MAPGVRRAREAQVLVASAGPVVPAEQELTLVEVVDLGVAAEPAVVALEARVVLAEMDSAVVLVTCKSITAVRSRLLVRPLTASS